MGQAQMKRIAKLVLLAVLIGGMAGCECGRVTMTVSSDPDLGEHIRTKNRYRITTIAENDEKFATPEGKLRYRMLKIAEADSMRPIFEKYQPGVFASDGIPVVIKNENGRSQPYDDNNSILTPLIMGLGACTVGILPGWLSWGLRRSYVVESVDGQRVDQRVVVEVKHLSMRSSLPFFMWIWLALQKETEVVDGHRSFVVSSDDGKVDVVWASVTAGEKKYMMRALTYAIAARLKKLEDENKVLGGAK